MGTDTAKFTGYIEGTRRDAFASAKLPPPGTTRWVPRRKAEVVAAVQCGALSLHDACERYTLTVEEFLSWQSAMERYGLAGLRSTHAQQYRLTRMEKARKAQPARTERDLSRMEGIRFTPVN